MYATEMQNCMYLIIDLATRATLVVDPCWDTRTLVRRLRHEGCRLVGILVGHAHFDHTGGLTPVPLLENSKMKVRVPGITTLLPYAHVSPCPIHIHPLDLPLLQLNDPDLFSHPKLIPLRSFCHETQFTLGQSTRIELVHLPGMEQRVNYQLI
ncbi:hypothetical protein HMI54_005789 [Coelomomyces lativittatus]|nr:hypothetical protein HMI54_005789 [Coelomomyces lativittatus]